MLFSGSHFYPHCPALPLWDSETEEAPCYIRVGGVALLQNERLHLDWKASKMSDDSFSFVKYKENKYLLWIISYESTFKCFWFLPIRFKWIYFSSYFNGFKTPRNTYLFIYSSPEDILSLILRERGREKERNIDWLPPVHTPIRHQACNLGMCHDRESNLRCFGVWDDAPSTWVTRPGPYLVFYL